MMRKEMLAKINELLDNTKNIKISNIILADNILNLIEQEGMSPPPTLIKNGSMHSYYSGWEKDNKEKLC